MTVEGVNQTPKSYLALSAVPDLLTEDIEASTSIERELEAVEAGDFAAIDRLIAYVWPSGLVDSPASLAYQALLAERDAPIITESELRLLDGNR